MLAAGTAAQASFSSISFAIAVLAPALREEYELSLTQIGVVLAAEWVGLTIALLPWGFAVDVGSAASALDVLGGDGAELHAEAGGARGVGNAGVQVSAREAQQITGLDHDA